MAEGDFVDVFSGDFSEKSGAPGSSLGGLVVQLFDAGGRGDLRDNFVGCHGNQPQAEGAGSPVAAQELGGHRWHAQLLLVICFWLKFA